MIKLRAVIRRRRLVLAGGLILGILAGVLSSLTAPKDDGVQRFSVTQLVVANRGAVAGADVEQDALRVTRGKVAEDAAQALGIQNPQAAAAKIKAEAAKETSSIEITSVDEDPSVAAKRVAAFADAFLANANADALSELQSNVTVLQSRLDDAEAALAAFDAINPALVDNPANPLVSPELIEQRRELVSAINTNRTELENEQLRVQSRLPYSTLGADPPKRAQSSALVAVPASLPLRATLLGILGLALASLLVLLLERINPRIDTRAELVETSQLPILAEIVYTQEAKRAEQPDGRVILDGAWAEPFRRVRSAIQYATDTNGAGAGVAVNGSHPPRVFLITSVSPAEGKSTTVTLTAQALAEVGVPTLVVGADFRRPQVERMLGAAPDPSIADMARLDINRPTVDDVVQETEFDGLYVAAAGAGTREVTARLEAAREVATIARSRGATVLIDTAPLRAANDTIDLLPAVDQVILVVRAGSTTASGVAEAIDTIERMNSSVLGFVLTGTTPTPGDGSYYDYYSYYASST